MRQRHGRVHISRASARKSQTPYPPSGERARITIVSDDVSWLKAELAAARAKISKLESMAEVDPLLNILNRRGFERELRRALAYVKRYNTPAAFVYIDLDAFKLVNDTHGHAAGDAVLKAVVRMLARNVRSSDVLARLGGDEFGVLLFNLNDTEAIEKAATLERLVPTAVVPWTDRNLSVGASAGVTAINGKDKPATVLARADAAMYARKAQRRRKRVRASRESS